ncbi:MAG: ABC transporter permease [Bauldia sp.]|nr:ABC transporter permease [Bauldia sp.]
MLTALTIARKEVAQRLRDKSFLIVGILSPLVLAFIFNLVLGDIVRPDPSLTFDFGVVDEDGAELGGAFGQMLAAAEADGLVTVTRYDTEAAATAAVDADEVAAAFILPDGLSAAVLVMNQDATIRVVGNVDSSIGRAVAEAMAGRFAEIVRTASLSVQAALAAGAITPDQIGAAVAAATAAEPVLAAATVEVRSRQLASATFFVAGLGIFFIFFIVGLSVTSLLEERTHGTLARLLAAPIRPASIVAGKTLASIGLGVLAMAILAIASTILMGAEWGNPAIAALVILAAVIAAAGIMIFVGGLARTAEQAQNLQTVVGLTLAMLGGTFVPITTSEGFLASVRYVTPNAWYMRGLGDASGGAYGGAFQAIGILLLFGIVFGGVGLLLVRRVVKP